MTTSSNSDNVKVVESSSRNDTSAATAAAGSNVSTWSRRTRSAPRETPQMNTLDHDGTDFDVENPRIIADSDSNTPTETKTPNHKTIITTPPSVKSWRPPTPPPSERKRHNSDGAAEQKKSPSLSSSSSSSWWRPRWTRSTSSPSLSSMDKKELGISTGIPTATDFSDILIGTSGSLSPATLRNDETKDIDHTTTTTTTIKKHFKHIKNKKLLEPLQKQPSHEDEDAAVTTNTNKKKEASNPTTTTTTREDELRQDCSFFYRDMDDDDSNVNGNEADMAVGGDTTTTAAMTNAMEEFEDEFHVSAMLGQHHYRTRREEHMAKNLFRNRLARKFRRTRGRRRNYTRMDGLNSATTLTRNGGNHIVQTESPSHISFRTRFDELNAIIPPSAVRRNGGDGSGDESENEDDISDIHFDLELQLETGGNGDGCDSEIPRVANFAQSSSLSYYHDGKVLMRLPQDNVRLLVDPDLAPGILSVERKPRPTTAAASKKKKRKKKNKVPSSEDSSSQAQETEGNTLNNNTNHTNKWKEELTYVLTVDENVYKGLLSEIFNSERTPCGLYYCCAEADNKGHVHIGVAVFIMTIFMIILFVNTVIYPF